MRRTSVIVSTLLLLAVGVLGSGWLPTRAQQGTPAAANVVDVAIGLLGTGQPEAAPGHALELRRVVFEPGGSIANHVHPGALVLYIESGALTYAVVEGSVAIQRAAEDGTPGPTEELGPGDETVLNPGDALFEQAVVHSARNDGDEPTTVLVSSVAEAGEPFTVFDLP
jgi:quercetin dioxygenase-like cupin family protein